jgi:hypothetical protein
MIDEHDARELANAEADFRLQQKSLRSAKWRLAKGYLLYLIGLLLVCFSGTSFYFLVGGVLVIIGIRVQVSSEKLIAAARERLEKAEYQVSLMQARFAVALVKELKCQQKEK